MKTQRSVIIIVLIAAVIIALLQGFKKISLQSVPNTAVTEANSTRLPTAIYDKTVTTPETFNTTDAKASSTNTIASLDKGNQLKEGLGKLNDVDIVFYGKVEDQFGGAVADATVNFGVRIYNSFESTVKYGETKSDANGLFTISGYRGESLGLGVKKNGYAFISMNGSGVYSQMWPEEKRAHPDTNNPVVIKMWKLQGAEPLVGLNKTYKLRYTNAPIYFDLVAGEIVPSGGDLKITVNRPDGIISQQHPQNWNIQIEVVNGGLIETSGKESAITFAAPETNYQPNGTFGNDNGSDVTHRAFFIQSRNEQVYSKLGLSFRINNNPDDFMYVTLSGVANTNSSRNWEATAPQ